jgi:hypothetical protein
MPAATCLRMGNEGVPLWLIDDAHPHPAQLVEHALDQTFAEAEETSIPASAPRHRFPIRTGCMTC